MVFQAPVNHQTLQIVKEEERLFYILFQYLGLRERERVKCIHTYNNNITT